MEKVVGHIDDEACRKKCLSLTRVPAIQILHSPGESYRHSSDGKAEVAKPVSGVACVEVADPR